MNILCLSAFFPRSGNGEITGGVEARNFYIKKFLGDKFNVLALSHDNKQGEEHFNLSLAKKAFSLIKQSSKIKFDAVEGTNFATFLPAWIIGFLNKKPVVFWYPDVWLNEWVANMGPVGYIGEIYEKIVLLLPVTKYIAISQTTKQKLIKAGIPENKIEVIYCGVDKSFRGNPTKKFTISIVSRLVPYKHVDVLIKALKILKNSHPESDLVIVGDGPERNYLQKLARDLKIDKDVHFLGFIPKHANVQKTMSESKIFCLPSTVEGFGIVLIEAASLGVPVVASDIPVIREVLGTNGGTFFKPLDSADLASNLRKLLDDKKFLRKKSSNALIAARKFSWKDIAAQTEKLYARLIKA